MAKEMEKVTAYLETLSEDQRGALENLRRVIRDALPEAEECISYGVPAFCLNGRPLVSYGASRKHCAFYPMDPTILSSHLSELTGFETSKGTIRFQPDAPIPRSVVQQIVRERAASARGLS